MLFPRQIKESYKHAEIRIIDDNNSLAVYDHICKKCGHDKAEIIEKGQMYSDEDDIILYVCGKCGYTEMQDAKIK